MRFSRLPRGVWTLGGAWPGAATPGGRWRRRALVAAGVVLLLPIVLVVLVLLLAAAVTFVAVVLVGRIVTGFASLFQLAPSPGGPSGGGGRRNVTVIRRD